MALSADGSCFSSGRTLPEGCAEAVPRRGKAMNDMTTPQDVQGAQTRETVWAEHGHKTLGARGQPLALSGV